MRRLTEPQIKALKWLPREGGRHWNGVKFGACNKAALRTLIRDGLATRVGHPDMDLYAITPAGRAALSQPTPTTEDKGREDRA